jgi:hypothetical protein
MEAKMSSDNEQMFDPSTIVFEENSAPPSVVIYGRRETATTALAQRILAANCEAFTTCFCQPCDVTSYLAISPRTRCISSGYDETYATRLALDKWRILNRENEIAVQEPRSVLVLDDCLYDEEQTCMLGLPRRLQMMTIVCLAYPMPLPDRCAIEYACIFHEPSRPHRNVLHAQYGAEFTSAAFDALLDDATQTRCVVFRKQAGVFRYCGSCEETVSYAK